MAKGNKHFGSSFDDFLEEEGILAELDAASLKRVIAWKFEEAIKKERLTKTEVAKRMKTSRASLDRLLDPENTGLNLKSMEKAAHALGKRVRIELEDLEH